ncbi:Cell cycle checkpoint protein, partial [Nymphaea thermarum]
FGSLVLQVDEVKLWLEERLISTKKRYGDNVLVITGPAGIGKSATVYVVASDIGAEVCEWKTPTPIIWQEYSHSAKSGLQYRSKLDEFEAFVDGIQKYPLLPSASDGVPKTPVMLLIDDLPLTSRRDSRGRLCKCLQWLAQSAQYPTIVSITECGKSEAGCTSYYGEEVVSYLEKFGVPKVAFNPITVNSIKRVLAKICKEEELSMSPGWIDHIARGSGGDIRHAIMSLQYYSLRVDLMLSSPLSNMVISTPKSEASKSGGRFSNPRIRDDFNEGFIPLAVGRDETLTLFHGLGKFLHNKRDPIPAVENDGCFPLRKELARLPLKMDSPENIFLQAHGEARQVLEFLHENVLDFISDEAVDDAFTVASYLSEADGLVATSLSSSRTAMLDRYDARSLSQFLAASVAIRGVLFGNSRPSSSRWHSIRSPKLWQVEQSFQQRKKEILEKRLKICSNFSSSCFSIFAAEFNPSLRWLEHRVAMSAEAGEPPMQLLGKFESGWTHSGGHLFSSRHSSSDFPNEEWGESEDEIEDW